MEPHELPHDLPDGTDAGPDPGALDAPTVSLLLPGGAHGVAAATVDSDADGAPDTAVVPAPRGPDGADVLALATDTDHDGVADVLTTVAADGTARTVTLPGDGWEPGWDAPAPPGAVLDPTTGAWTRSL